MDSCAGASFASDSDGWDPLPESTSSLEAASSSCWSPASGNSSSLSTCASTGTRDLLSVTGAGFCALAGGSTCRATGLDWAGPDYYNFQIAPNTAVLRRQVETTGLLTLEANSEAIAGSSSALLAMNDKPDSALSGRGVSDFALLFLPMIVLRDGMLYCLIARCTPKTKSSPIAAKPRDPLKRIRSLTESQSSDALWPAPWNSHSTQDRTCHALSLRPEHPSTSYCRVFIAQY